MSEQKESPQFDLTIQNKKSNIFKIKKSNFLSKYFFPHLTIVMFISIFFISIFFSFKLGVEKGSSENIPFIRADLSPLKKPPQDPGGLEVRDQESRIFGIMGESDNKNIIEQLLPPPEQPIIEDANQTSENIEDKRVDNVISVPVLADEPLNTDNTEQKELAIVDNTISLGVEGAFKAQLGAYQFREDALSGWTVIKLLHSDLLTDLIPDIQEYRDNETVFYRLRVGPFLEISDANLFCEEMANRNYDCIVVDSTNP